MLPTLIIINSIIIVLFIAWLILAIVQVSRSLDKQKRDKRSSKITSYPYITITEHQWDQTLKYAFDCGKYYQKDKDLTISTEKECLDRAIHVAKLQLHTTKALRENKNTNENEQN